MKKNGKKWWIHVKVINYHSQSITSNKLW